MPATGRTGYIQCDSTQSNVLFNNFESNESGKIGEPLAEIAKGRGFVDAIDIRMDVRHNFLCIN
jgi:hypothetical protein